MGKVAPFEVWDGTWREKLTVSCGPCDNRGERIVVAVLGGVDHRDQFDTNIAWKRRQFRESACDKLGLSDDAHEFIESQLLAKADAADAADAEPVETLMVKPASEYEMKTVEWFWPGYIPAGAITGFDGDPDKGKSQLLCWFAGAVTGHRTLPDGSRIPDSVGRGAIMFIAEDDVSRVVRPRLEAVGADTSRVDIVVGVQGVAESERSFVLPRDVPMLEKLVRERDAGLVCLDPLTAFLDDSINMNVDADMRRAMKPLAAMAERTGAAVVFLRHLNKREGSSAMYRGGGSVAIIAASRAAYLIAEAPDDPDLRIFACNKLNLAPKPRSLTYTIEPHGDVSRIVWGCESDVSAADLLGSSKGSGGSKLEEAKRIIADILAGGGRGSGEVEDACTAAGISKGTYWSARKQMGLVAEKVGFGSGWMVSLPASDDPQPYPEFD